ncbi:MAG TPA: TonB-dependent receptor plug domain-containing protein [Flavisolibacter sp.]|nr:TonB-dependent receptor plug domain-containing protein [Flavisolibacter sp.]
MKRFAFWVCLLSSLNSLAQQKDTADLLPVEVKAVRASATAPFAKTNITKKEIERQNLGQDLPMLLNQTPSVVVNSDAGNGVGYTYIHIRGSDATRINVTLNGIPYNDAESEQTYFVDLPDFASSVNSIQIQRGVGTSSNGAGAFGATINFSTNEINKKAYAEVNNSFGSFNTWKNTIKAGSGLIGRHFTTDIRLSRISSSGYIDRASSDLRSLYFSTAYLSDKTDLRFTILPGKEKTYQAWYGVTNDDLKTHRTMNYAGTEKTGSPYPNETDNYWQTHYQLYLTQRFTSNLNFTSALFYTKGKGYYEEYKTNQDYSEYHMSYPVIGNDTVYTTDLVRRLWLNNDFYGTTFSLQQHSNNTQLTFGGAVTRYTGAHYGEVTWAQSGITGNPKYYDVNAAKNDLNVYGKWQQDVSSLLQVFTDLQYRRVNYHLNGFQYNPTLYLNPVYNFFNPKIGFTYHIKDLLAYASYSISNKEPIRDDFEASLQQQPNAEHLEDLEIGIEKRNNNNSWSANFYYMNYKDQLVLTGKINDVGAYTRTNIPESYRVGLELTGSVNILKWIRASGNLTLSRNKVKDFKEYIDDYDNGGQKSISYNLTDISFSPNIIGAATVSIDPFKQFNLSLIGKYVGKQYLDNTSSNDRKLNSYYIQDIRAVYTLNKKKFKNIDVIFQVYNLFDKKYEPNGSTYSYYSGNNLVTDNYYLPMAGINYMVGLNLSL